MVIRKGSKILFIILSLIILFIFQFFSVYGKFSIPFYDTRIHYNRDNALFLTKAYDGNKLLTFRSEFGITSNTYDSNGNVIKTGYYTHHPFLMKALFQQYTKLFGYSERVSRSFYFIINSLILIIIFFIAYLVLTDTLLALLVSFFVLSLPLFMEFQTCIKFETDGIFFMLLNIFLLLIYFKKYFYSDPKNRFILSLLFISTFLLPFAHRPDYIFYFILLAYFGFRYFKNKNSSYRVIFGIYAISGLIGILSYFLLVVYIQGGFNKFFSDLIHAFMYRTNNLGNKIPFGFYLERQKIYISMNYTWIIFWLFVFLVAYLIYGFRKYKFMKDDFYDLFRIIIFSTLISAVVWQFLFTNGSFIHNYWQYYFYVPLFLLVTYVMYNYRNFFRDIRIKAIIFLFIFLLYMYSYGEYNRLVKNQLGTQKTIELLKEIKGEKFDKLIYIPLINTSLNSRFQGPEFKYYTGRPILILKPNYKFKGTEKIVLLKYNNQKYVVSILEKKLGIKLTNEKCSDFLCIYDISK